MQNMFWRLYLNFFDVFRNPKILQESCHIQSKYGATYILRPFLRTGGSQDSTACCLCLSRQVEWIGRLELFVLLGVSCHTNGSMQRSLEWTGWWLYVCKDSPEKNKYISDQTKIMKANTTGYCNVLPDLRLKVYSAI